MKSFFVFALGALVATVFLAHAKKPPTVEVIEPEVEPRFFQTRIETQQKYLH